MVGGERVSGRPRRSCDNNEKKTTLSIPDVFRYSQGIDGEMHPQPQRRPTLHDVAARAHVSFKTVARVVNGEGGVSARLTGRVEAAVAELGYRPDDRARRLRNTEQRTNVIGFILVDVANPFFSSILRGIEDVARKRDYLVLSGSTDGDPARQNQLVSAFVSRRVDGMIVVPSGDALGPLAHEIERGTPLVFVDLEPSGTAVDFVRSDHHGGARLATEHLLRAGHRDIAFFGSPLEISSGGQRYAGFREAMAAAGLTVPDSRMRTGLYTPDGWHGIVKDFFANGAGPTAIFTAQNFITLGALRALHELGLRNSVAHIGFDDVELGAVVSPGMSVVPQYPLELGRRATEMLFNRLDGRSRSPVQELLPSTIIERGSGEIGPSTPGLRSRTVGRKRAS